MNNIESIIKYLSGDLDSNASCEFEKAMDTDSALSEEYLSVLKIWNIIKDQLSLEDVPDGKKREEYIAEVIAAHDVEYYRSERLSKKEQKFKDELKNIIDAEAAVMSMEKTKSVKLIYRLSIFIASAAAIALLLLIPGTDLDQLAGDYYKPTKDNALDKYKSTSRSKESNAMFLFSQGNFKAARVSFEKNLSGIHKTEEIFYAICCYETGDPEKAIIVLNNLSLVSDHEVSATASWYLALIHIQEGNTTEAQNQLYKLNEKEGIYKKKTARLLRKMEH